jgi:hypothetical protein
MPDLLHDCSPAKFGRFVVEGGTSAAAAAAAELIRRLNLQEQQQQQQHPSSLKEVVRVPDLLHDCSPAKVGGCLAWWWGGLLVMAAVGAT